MVIAEEIVQDSTWADLTEYWVESECSKNVSFCYWSNKRESSLSECLDNQKNLHKICNHWDDTKKDENRSFSEQSIPPGWQYNIQRNIIQWGLFHNFVSQYYWSIKRFTGDKPAQIGWNQNLRALSRKRCFEFILCASHLLSGVFVV